MKIKLKAYTLMEVLITLSLTGLLMLMAGYVFSNAQKFLHKDQAQRQANYESLFFHETLRNDISEAEIIKASRFGFELFKDEKVVYYEFYNKEITRKVDGHERLFKFDFEQPSFKMIDQLNDVIRHIEFITFTKDQKTRRVYRKEYEKRFLFDLEVQNKIR